MSEPKIIVVVGATGAQGSGLVEAIQRDPAGSFRARAITRDPGSAKSRALAALGAEIVQGDLDDAASIQRAFEGAWGAYCVTFFWAHFSPERELAEARTMAEAARDAGLRHVIWSTLEDTRRWVPLDDARMPTLMGRYKVPHFDAKGEADAIFSELGVPTTFLLTSFYWDNFIHFGLGPKRGADGRLALALPIGQARLPGIAAEDIGACAYGILRRGQELVGRHIGVAGEHLSGLEMAAAMSRGIGEQVVFHDIAPSAFRSLGFPGAEDLGNMFQFKRDFERDFRAARDVAFARSLHPGLQSFADWLARHGSQIPLG